jgi:hypothetical protein
VKAGAQRIVEQQGAVEAVAEPKQLLQYLDRLQGTEDAGDGAEDAGGLAARDEVGRRRLAEQAAVAGVAAQISGRSKSFGAWPPASGFSRQQVGERRVAKLSLPSATRRRRRQLRRLGAGRPGGSRRARRD